MFRTLPLKKDYPDYYKVISEAIDMTMIENKIKLDKVRKAGDHTLQIQITNTAVKDGLV